MRIKYVCIKKNSKDKDNTDSEYIAQVGLSEVPSDTWKKYFNFKYRRGTVIRKGKVNIKENEVVVKIDKGKDIQDYIEIISRVISETNISVKEYTEQILPESETLSYKIGESGNTGILNVTCYNFLR